VGAGACDAPLQYIGYLNYAVASATGFKDLPVNLHRAAKYDRLPLPEFSHPHTSYQQSA
jgi:hypothetical protein